MYGLRLDEFPGTAIHRFHLSVTATHTLTNGNVSKQAYYEVQDLMIGHRFEDQTSFDVPTRTFSFDYSKMNRTKPAYVWYPSKSNYESRPDLTNNVYKSDTKSWSQLIALHSFRFHFLTLSWKSPKICQEKNAHSIHSSIQIMILSAHAIILLCFISRRQNIRFLLL